jgi:hypothetical protein
MQAQVGSRELASSAAAYVACLTFALCYLLVTAHGGSGLTAALRGALVAFATWWPGQLLLRPIASLLLDAIAKDKAARAKGDAEP